MKFKNAFGIVDNMRFTEAIKINTLEVTEVFSVFDFENRKEFQDYLISQFGDMDVNYLSVGMYGDIFVILF